MKQDKTTFSILPPSFNQLIDFVVRLDAQPLRIELHQEWN